MNEMFKRCLKQIPGARMIYDFNNATFEPTCVHFSCPVCKGAFQLVVRETNTGIFFTCQMGCDSDHVFEKLTQFGIGCSVNRECYRSALDYPEIVADLERMLALPAYESNKK